MKRKSNKFSKKGKIWIGVAAGLSVLAVTFGLVFGLNDFSRNKFEQPENIQSIMGPNNSTYWDEDTSRLDLDWAGSGTESDPWLISSAAELAGLSYAVYKDAKPAYANTGYYFKGMYFKQTANIDVSAYYWRPIGTGSYFSGNYNGNAYTITGVCTKAGANNQGLFGYCETYSDYGRIENINLTNSLIVNSSNNYIGGIAGAVAYYIINACSVSSSVIINGNNNVGGIVGSITYNSQISNCYSCADTVSGTNMLGGIAGQVSMNTVMNNCYNQGTVYPNSSGQYVGGFVGYVNDNSEVYNCYNVGQVTSATSYVGGGVGYNSTETGAVVDYCFYGGSCTLLDGIGNFQGVCAKRSNITTTAKTSAWYADTVDWNASYPWDFVDTWEFGSNANGYPTLQATKMTLTINANGGTYSGETIIKKVAGSTVTISTPTRSGYGFNGWSLSGGGSISGSTYTFGSSDGTLTASWSKYPTLTIYVNGGTYSGSTSISQAAGTTTGISTPTKKYCEFVGWSLSGGGTMTGTTYTFGTSNGYLYAEWNVIAWPGLASTSFAGGNGTETNPYKIATANQLALLSKNVAAGTTYRDMYFKQTANIDLDGYEWVPIGDDDNYIFKGNYDGGNYTISRMSITNAQYWAVGLFGEVLGGTLSNIHLKNSSIYTDQEEVGGIVGYSNSIIENCTSDCYIESTGSNTGGICGDGAASIINCVNYGEINGRSYTGGIVGCEVSSLENCVNYGKVTGKDYTGGIIGADSYHTENCTNNGNVTGTMFVGGISGTVCPIIASNPSESDLERCRTIKCINNGRVSGSRFVGLIAGYTQSYGTNSTVVIEDCIARGFLNDDSGELSIYRAGIIGGTNGANVVINNCSVVASTNGTPQTFVGTLTSGLTVTITASYASIGGVKVYTNGDFSDWGLVDDMNSGLPLQRELFWDANFSSATSDDVIFRLEENGFIIY